MQTGSCHDQVEDGCTSSLDLPLRCKTGGVWSSLTLLLEPRRHAREGADWPQCVSKAPPPPWWRWGLGNAFRPAPSLTICLWYIAQLISVRLYSRNKEICNYRYTYNLKASSFGTCCTRTYGERCSMLQLLSPLLCDSGLGFFSPHPLSHIYLFIFF